VLIFIAEGFPILSHILAKLSPVIILLVNQLDFKSTPISFSRSLKALFHSDLRKLFLKGGSVVFSFAFRFAKAFLKGGSVVFSFAFSFASSFF
jgi:hypothetical protein